MSGSEATAKTSSQTLDRGLQLLELVAGAPEPMTISQLAVAVGVHRTIAHRLAATLTARGYLRREASGGYRVGATCLALASGVSDLRAIARPVLEDLARTTEETVHLVVLSGPDVVFVDGFESPQALRVATRVGRRVPAHATSVGKAWLAALDPDRLRELYPHHSLPTVTAHTVSDRAALERELHTIRERGYATSDGESETGVGSVGMVVRDPAGEPCAAVSVAMPLARITTDTTRTVVEALSIAVSGLAKRLF